MAVESSASGGETASAATSIATTTAAVGASPAVPTTSASAIDLVQEDDNEAKARGEPTVVGSTRVPSPASITPPTTIEKGAEGSGRVIMASSLASSEAGKRTKCATGVVRSTSSSGTAVCGRGPRKRGKGRSDVRDGGARVRWANYKAIESDFVEGCMPKQSLGFVHEFERNERLLDA